MTTPSRRLALAAAAAVLLGWTASASALRVMTYNILNYSSGREAEFELVLAETDPDVLVVQEILTQTAVNNFLNNILDDVHPGEWAAAPFVNGYDTDNALFYRTARAQHVAHYVISTALRDIDEWTIRPAGYASSAANVRLYVLHLKASQGTDNEAKRLAEVTAMRTRMETFPAGQNYLVLGDFNIYKSSEPAYGYMLSSANGLAGVVEDPIDTPGYWHNSASFASIHTQSPRTLQFGGGANGGMDDRFDLILVGPAVEDGEGFDILDATYTAFGQDGLHFNIALTDPPDNGVVSAAVAQALHDGSDHLPVYADFQVPAQASVSAALAFGSVIVGGTAVENLSVANPADVPGDELDYGLAAPAGFSAPAGPFTAAAGASANLHDVSLDTGACGARAGDLTVTTDDPDQPVILVPLTGTVLAHARPSVSAAVEATADSLDFGTHAPGGFADLPATAHNFGYGSLQALLDVHEATLAGDPRFSLGGGCVGTLVGSTPASCNVHFDDTGAADGVYAGTLTLATRDQQDLSGAADCADLTYHLVATVDGGGVVGAELSATGPTRLGFVSIAPNPFAAGTTIRYGVSRAGDVRLRIHDLRGRRVRELVARPVGAGDHALTWDGRDDRGRLLAAGIYFARLVTPDGTETRRLVRLR